MAELENVSALETVPVYNPKNEEFSVRFNGELFKLAPKSSRHYPRFLAFHIAKHLSSLMLAPLVEKAIKKSGTNPFAPDVTRLTVHDNPERRIALYDILQDKNLVEACIGSTSLKPFIGNMAEYDDYVSQKETKGKSKEE